MDKLVEHGIRMLEIAEGENDFFRNDAKRQADIARAVYDTILRVQALECRADRKTEPSGSENPNNCEDEPQTMLEAVIDKTTEEDRRKMEEFIHKAIKTEPQTDCEDCKYAWWDSDRYECSVPKCRYEPKDEPQTERSE